jgi:flagellar biosynthesis/type III secretory pathway chaperone
MTKDLRFLYNALLLSLEQEYDRYKELFSAVEEESELFLNKSSTSADLDTFNKRHEQLIISLQMASDIRMSAIKKITDHLHFNEPVTMTLLISHAQDQIRQNLLNYQEKFTALILQIKKMNDRNKNLIAVSLSQINNTLSYINGLTCSSPSYDQRGHVRAGNLQSRLISKAG